jgi:hypothetical protein
MLFNFQLRDLVDIAPWGYPEQPVLHWFGLTDGWYWLQMNENDEFFRYSTDLLTHWQRNDPEVSPLLPYADYYVVRLWEDILELLPTILEPLPPKFAHLLETEEQVSRWQKRVKLWEKAIGIEEKGEEEQTEDDEDEDNMEVWETYLQATMWWHDRELSTHPFTAPPRLWFWNDGQSIHGFWDNSKLYIENLPAWEAQRGQIRLTTTQFLDEVNSFHTRLFIAMEEPIQEAKRMPYRNVQREGAELRSGRVYVPLPSYNIRYSISDIALDLDKLEEEHQVRFRSLAQSLERAASSAETDWNAVVDAMRTMDRLSGFLAEEK